MNASSSSASGGVQWAWRWVLGIVTLLIVTSCAVPAGNGGLSGDATPNVQGIYQGSYTYGSAYQKLAGQSVTFEIALQQARGSSKIKGVIKETYTGFGTAKNGYLWADIVGTCEEENGYTHLKFTKTYRNFRQPPVEYHGSLPPGSTLLAGTWFFPDKASDSGMFQISNLQVR